MRNAWSTWRKSKSLVCRRGLKELGQFSFKEGVVWRYWSQSPSTGGCCREQRRNVLCISTSGGTGSGCRQEMQWGCGGHSCRGRQGSTAPVQLQGCRAHWASAAGLAQYLSGGMQGPLVLLGSEGWAGGPPGSAPSSAL